MKYLFLIISLVMMIGILYFFCFIYFNPPNMGGGTGSENKNQNDILKEILKELKRLKKDEL